MLEFSSPGLRPQLFVLLTLTTGKVSVSHLPQLSFGMCTYLAQLQSQLNGKILKVLKPGPQ